MNVHEVKFSITPRQLFWAAFAAGAGLLCGLCTVIAAARALRAVAQFLGLAA